MLLVSHDDFNREIYTASFQGTTKARDLSRVSLISLKEKLLSLLIQPKEKLIELFRAGVGMQIFLDDAAKALNYICLLLFGISGEFLDEC
jgi:hypothetical protein